MDDYFQYLLYLFIIISFLSSILKKKNKPQSKQEGPLPNPSAKPLLSSQQEDYDIMKEIENMFKTQSPQSEKQKEISLEERKYETDSEHVEEQKWHEETKSEHRLESWDDKRKKAEVKLKQNLNEKILKEAELFERNLAKKNQVTEVRKDLIKKLKQPSTLKEYVVISEILGKPKAFQE